MDEEMEKREREYFQDLRLFELPGLETSSILRLT